MSKFLSDLDSQGFQPMVQEAVVIDVTFSNGFLSKYVDKFVINISQRIELMGGTISIDGAKIKRYLDSLLYLRIKLSRSEKVEFPTRFLGVLYVPAIFQLALSKIGYVQDSDSKEIFLPKWEWKDPDNPSSTFDLMSREEMTEVSNLLDILNEYGIESNKAFPLSREGELSFMTWILIEKEGTRFWREDKKAPMSDAVLLSLFEIQRLDCILRPKFYYGTSSYFDSLLDALLVDVTRVRRHTQ